MKKIYWFFIILAIILAMFILFFKTDIFQQLGLRIPRNYQECVRYGGHVEVVGNQKTDMAVLSYCVWKGIKYNGEYINY